MFQSTNQKDGEARAKYLDEFLGEVQQRKGRSATRNFVSTVHTAEMKGKAKEQKRSTVHL